MPYRQNSFKILKHIFLTHICIITLKHDLYKPVGRNSEHFVALLNRDRVYK
jgi:hypothetical protein